MEVATAKGWVRDGILSSLAKRPGTVSEIAKELGVSKATVSYHTKSLIRRNIIEISDVKSIRGGVYSKTLALQRGSLVLVRRRAEQEDSSSKLDEVFERLLMSWHLRPERKPADEIEVFLYHAFRLLAESDSLDADAFEALGRRVGEELISAPLRFETLKNGLKELTVYLAREEMAEMTSEASGGSARLVCTGCFENKEYGSLVCSFTKGIIEGTLRAKRAGRYSVVRNEKQRVPLCAFDIRGRRVAS